MDFIPAAIETYALEHTTAEPSHLQELSRETYAKVLYPRMLSGHLQGKVLEAFSYMLSPGRILEIGTFTGYSAICLAKGLNEGGKIITIDINDELQPYIRKYVDEAGMNGRIEYKFGNALDIIPQLDETFDLVFIDADKENYSNYFDLVIDKVRKNGFIIADNVLWSGKVLYNSDNDKETQGIIDFNNKVHADPRVENVLLPVRDGLMIMRKI